MEDDRSEMEDMKETNPARWCEYTRAAISQMIMEHNMIAGGIDDQPIIYAALLTDKDKEDFFYGRDTDAEDTRETDDKEQNNKE